jgi:hypothetical protein
MPNDMNAKFGPCGLLCEKCFANNNGPIRYHAEELKKHLGEFDLYAKRFCSLLEEPRFGNYAAFKDFLDLLAANNCDGCRKQECHLFKNCNVNKCYKEKKVDYCYLCDEFPCSKTGFDENLHQRWLKINYRIKEIGLEGYYNEIKDKSRY